MRMRDREPENVSRMRAAHAQEFALVEDTLDLAGRIFSNRRLPNPGGDALLGRVTIGLIVKIIHVFWGVVVEAERALPSSSLVRELTEAVISLAYLLKEDSANRAQLYRDHMVVRDLRDMNRRLNDPDSRDVVTPEYRRLVEDNVHQVILRRTEPVFEEMRSWPTWGGDFSLETMARRAGIPGTLITLLYAMESRAPHAMDISSHVALTPEGDIIATLPAEAERHLMPSTALVLMALHLATQAFHINHERELELLNQRMLRISGLSEESSRHGGS